MATVLALVMFGAAGTAHAELTSEVRITGGKPALFVNGEQKSLILGAPYRSSSFDSGPIPGALTFTLEGDLGPRHRFPVPAGARSGATGVRANRIR